jgi:hypothetical protein
MQIKMSQDVFANLKKKNLATVFKSNFQIA